MSLHEDALTILIEGHRAIADQLEALRTQGGRSPRSTAGPAAAAPIQPGAMFDPEFDAPRLPPKPKGTSEEQQWSMVVFFGRVHAINVRQGRGATIEEQRAIGTAAGYKGRSGYNGWPWTWADRQDGRWVTDEEDLSSHDRDHKHLSGMGFLRWAAQQLDITLPPDLA